MSYWNHRVIYKKDTKTGFESFEIHKVYYSKKGKIKSWTVSSVAPFGETKKVLKKPILTERTKCKKTKLIEFN